eukprot:6175306-Pleurochrysis_carterae.AAC.2
MITLSRFRCVFRWHAAQVRYDLGRGSRDPAVYDRQSVRSQVPAGRSREYKRHCINHSSCLSEAVAVQIAQQFLQDKNSNIENFLSAANCPSARPCNSRILAFH